MCADGAVPDGVMFQILCVICVVIRGQEKLQGIEIEYGIKLTLVVLLSL